MWKGEESTNRVVKRRISDTSSHKPRDVRHIRHEDRPDRVTDLAHALVVVAARICRRTSNNQLRTEDRHHTLELCIVNKSGLRVKMVRHGLPEERCRRNTLLGTHVSMRKAVVDSVSKKSQVWKEKNRYKLATMRKVETHEAVVRLEKGSVDREVGRASRKRLHVDTPLCRVEMERLQCTLLAQQFVLICKLVPTVVTRPRIALAVLVSEAGAQCVAHSLRADVL